MSNKSKNNQVITGFQILNFVKANPGANTAKVAEFAELTPSGVLPYLDALIELGEIEMFQDKAPNSANGKMLTMACYRRLSPAQDAQIEKLKSQRDNLLEWQDWALTVCPQLQVGKAMLAARIQLAKHIEDQAQAKSILAGEHDDTGPMKAVLELMANA